MKKIKFRYFIPAIVIMMIIFMMSNMNASESSSQSGFIQTLLYDILHLYIPMIIIRKGAHMSEYAMLFLCLYYGCYKNKINSFLYPYLITIIYACTDELHQLFIGGRAGKFTDVVIDGSGALIMILIILFFKKMVTTKK